MLEGLGLERSDFRNLAVVVGIMMAIMMVILDTPLGSRLITAFILGLVTAVSFLVVTVLMKRFGPEKY